MINLRLITTIAILIVAAYAASHGWFFTVACMYLGLMWAWMRSVRNTILALRDERDKMTTALNDTIALTGALSAQMTRLALALEQVVHETRDR